MRSKSQKENAAPNRTNGAIAATDAKKEVLTQKFPFLAIPDNPEVHSM
jgi:hypothetical protein